VRVLFADGDAATRAGLRMALQSGGFQVCSEAASAADAVAGAIRERPDVCLLDVSLPGNGIDAARVIAAKLPDSALVMLADAPDDDDLFAALRAGASGYLSKRIAPARLAQALEGVLAGEAALSRQLTRSVVEAFRKNEDRGEPRRPIRRPAVLTPREWEVLSLLKEGLSTSEVAERLFVAPVTVRSHVAASVRKLHVPDRAAAVALLER
jgi:DNA-binding NarL/FixJ family response regulator